MSELWKAVPGMDGKIEASRLGEIRRVFKNGKYLNYKTRKDGSVHIRIGGKDTAPSVSRLVWEAFVGKIPEGYVIIKKNCVFLDCRLINLECVPAKEQNKYKCMRPPDAKPVIAFNRQTGHKIKFRSLAYCAKKHRMSRETLRKYIKTGTPHMGYVFKFVREEDIEPVRHYEKRR